MASGTSKKIQIVLQFVTLIALIFPASRANSATTVAGRYLLAQGKKVMLSINVHGSSRQNLIVEQYVQRNNKILSTQPTAAKISRAGNSAKWLFKGLRQGSQTVSMSLAKPLSPGDVSAIIRYRTDQGKLRELRIVP